MNEEEIPNKELPKPKRASKPKITPVPVYDDPYADDFEWNPGVGNTQTIDVSLVSDPYSEQKVEETVPFFEPAKPFYESEMSTAEPFNVEINQSPPLFQPDIIPNFVPEPFEPESTAETVRRSGLAYSIGIVFVVSVAFMLLLGWIADWMFGTKPWGLVGGIVFGSIIGFVQVVRISSRIFNPNKNGPALRPLMSHIDHNEPPALNNEQRENY